MLFPKFSDQSFKTKTILRHQLPEASHKEVPAGQGTGEGASALVTPVTRWTEKAPRGHRGTTVPTGCRVGSVTGAHEPY